MDTADWFSSWFDTNYYHTLYKNRDEQEARKFISNLMEFLDLPFDSTILDLACGKGRHSITLNELGYQVIGADLSANSIQNAKRFENERLHFVVHDMREVLPGYQFSAVLNLFTSFGYFDSVDDNLQVLRSVHQMLAPGGLFVIDFMNAQKVIADLVKEEHKTVDGVDFMIRRSFDGTHILKTIEFEDKGSPFSFTERVQALNATDFRSLFSQSGFELIRTFGNFELGDFDSERSHRLILVARKTEWK